MKKFKEKMCILGEIVGIGQRGMMLKDGRKGESLILEIKISYVRFR